ncbi:MAG TPA: hypothetical protein VFM84_02930 [Holophagaceae bacterium]|nr:hypothetical protein [Holophagaceae bacterium]
MKISDSQCDETTLTRMGAEACELITKGNYRELADRFGYALAFGKDTAEAIQMEVEDCLSKSGASERLSVPSQPAIRVGFFSPDSELFCAVVECQLKLTGGAGNMRIDLIVTNNGNEKYVTLEEISHTT